MTACNPVCEAGSVCTPEGLCVVPEDSPAQLEDATRRSEAAKHERLEYRMKPRMTVHGLITVASLAHGNATLLGVAGTLGYRQNLAETFGIQVRGGIGVGAAIADSSSSSGSSSSTGHPDDSAAALQVFGECGPFFGPLGRFYMGPIAWVGYFSFSRNKVHGYDAYGDVVHTASLPDVTRYGGGLDMGILALGHEQLDINWRLKSAFSKELPFIFEAGVGFHAM